MYNKCISTDGFQVLLQHKLRDYTYVIWITSNKTQLEYLDKIDLAWFGDPDKYFRDIEQTSIIKSQLDHSKYNVVELHEFLDDFESLIILKNNEKICNYQIKNYCSFINEFWSNSNEMLWESKKYVFNDKSGKGLKFMTRKNSSLEIVVLGSYAEC